MEMGLPSDEETIRTSLMIGKETKNTAEHLTTDLKEFNSRMNFSGLLRGLTKAWLFMIGPKDWSDTTKTKIVTLCDDPSTAPRIMMEVAMEHYRKTNPELMSHFQAILEAI